jgi:hypothetical protein
MPPSSYPSSTSCSSNPYYCSWGGQNGGYGNGYGGYGNGYGYGYGSYGGGRY